MVRELTTFITYLLSIFIILSFIFFLAFSSLCRNYFAIRSMTTKPITVTVDYFIDKSAPTGEFEVIYELPIAEVEAMKKNKQVNDAASQQQRNITNNRQRSTMSSISTSALRSNATTTTTSFTANPSRSAAHVSTTSVRHG